MECKRNLEKLDSFTKVHVVLGNESCDLDSAVSAIVTAYLLHELQPVTSILVVPVLNVVKKDLRLRTEITYFFEQVEIPLDSLVCRDDIDLKKLHSQSKLSLTLVDHNLLPKEDGDLQAAVQEIIDHHRLETSHRCDKTVEMVGSCCTLVAEKLLHTKPDLANPQVALLLYGTILLDTVCLSESARKTTAKDLEVISRLQSLLPELNKEEVFKPLSRAKANVDGLTLDELLRKDLKAVCSSAKRIAISSVPGELKSICQENTMEAELDKFCKTHGYSALIILTVAVEEKSNSVQRQLAVFSSDIMLKQQLTSTLLAVGDPSLDLQVSHMSTDHLITFVQGNAQASRKVILPVVRKFLSTLEDNVLPKMNEHAPQANGAIASANQPCPTTASSPEDTALRDPPFSPSDSSNSMSETAKDGGTEKPNDDSFLNSVCDVDVPSNAILYRAQTVDFPDSPHLRSAQRKTGSTCGEDETDDEALSRGDYMSQSEARRAVSCSPLSPLACNLDTSQPISLASELEEYYEDSLLSGRLAIRTSREPTLPVLSSSSPEFDGESEEAEPASEEPSFIDVSPAENCNVLVKHSTPNTSKTSLDHEVDDELCSDDVARINLHNVPPPPEEHSCSFLFDEKASGEVPDERLLAKIRGCFDEVKIKDSYVLSGRLQDLLSPKEVDEIVTNYVSYSSFIDDNILEAIASLAGASRGSARNGTQGSEKKVIVPNLEPFTDDSSDIVVVAYEEDSGSRVRSTESSKAASPLKQKSIHSGGGDYYSMPESGTLNSLRRIDVEQSLLDKLGTLSNGGDASRFVAEPPPGLQSLPADLSRQLEEDMSSQPDTNLPAATDLERSFDSEGVPCTPLELSLEEKLENGFSTPAERPSSLSGTHRQSRRKIKVNPDILRAQIGLDDDQKSLSSVSNKSDGDVFSPADDLATPDIETPDELGDSVLGRDDSTLSDSIPEMSAREEYAEERSWRTCNVGGVERKIDMRVIDPYKKVLSHGGYFGDDRQAIIVFSACHLPDRCRRDYDYVMDNLFLYVLSTLDQLVAESYVLIYLHGATERSKMPSFGWLKRCYQMIDRRLRKNLKGLYLVHPTFWLKTIVIMTRPFISSKFSRKLRFVYNLEELSGLVPLDHVCIPDRVKQLEFENMIKEKKRKLGNRKVLPGPREVVDDTS